MYDDILASILACLGMKEGFSLNVHCVVAVILFICIGTLFVRDMMKGLSDDKNWSSRPILIKIPIFAKGIFGLTIVCYIVYLLITWNTWSWETPLWVIMFPLAVFAVMAFCFGVTFLSGYLIYSWIKDMIMYLLKKE